LNPKNLKLFSLEKLSFRTFVNRRLNFTFSY